MANVLIRTLLQENRPAFLDSALVRLKTSGVTVGASSVVAGPDGRRVLRAGSVLGYDNTAGVYVPSTWNSTNGAWEPAPRGLLLEDVDLTNGNAEGALIDWGRVLPRALPFYAALGDDADTALAALARALPGITFVGYEWTVPEAPEGPGGGE